MWPNHIIVCEDGDFGHDLRNSSAHLAAFVGLCNTQYANLTGVESSNSPLRPLYAGVDGDNHDFKGLCCQTGLYCSAKIFSFPFNGRYNDSDILVGVIGIFGYGNWFVCPIGNQVDNKSKITEDAVDGGKHMAGM